MVIAQTIKNIRSQGLAGLQQRRNSRVRTIPESQTPQEVQRELSQEEKAIQELQSIPNPQEGTRFYDKSGGVVVSFDERTIGLAKALNISVGKAYQLEQSGQLGMRNGNVYYKGTNLGSSAQAEQEALRIVTARGQTGTTDSYRPITTAQQIQKIAESNKDLTAGEVLDIARETGVVQTISGAKPQLQFTKKDNTLSYQRIETKTIPTTQIDKPMLSLVESKPFTIKERIKSLYLSRIATKKDETYENILALPEAVSRGSELAGKKVESQLLKVPYFAEEQVLNINKPLPFQTRGTIFTSPTGEAYTPSTEFSAILPPRAVSVGKAVTLGTGAVVYGLAYSNPVTSSLFNTAFVGQAVRTLKNPEATLLQKTVSVATAIIPFALKGTKYIPRNQFGGVSKAEIEKLTKLPIDSVEYSTTRMKVLRGFEKQIEKGGKIAKEALSNQKLFTEAFPSVGEKPSGRYAQDLIAVQKVQTENLKYGFPETITADITLGLEQRKTIAKEIASRNMIVSSEKQIEQLLGKSVRGSETNYGVRDTIKGIEQYQPVKTEFGEVLFPKRKSVNLPSVKENFPEFYKKANTYQVGISKQVSGGIEREATIGFSLTETGKPTGLQLAIRTTPKDGKVSIIDIFEKGRRSKQKVGDLVVYKQEPIRKVETLLVKSEDFMGRKVNEVILRKYYPTFKKSEGLKRGKELIGESLFAKPSKEFLESKYTSLPVKEQQEIFEIVKPAGTRVDINKRVIKGIDTTTTIKELSISKKSLGIALGKGEGKVGLESFPRPKQLSPQEIKSALGKPKAKRNTLEELYGKPEVPKPTTPELIKPIPSEKPSIPTEIILKEETGIQKAIPQSEYYGKGGLISNEEILFSKDLKMIPALGKQSIRMNIIAKDNRINLPTKSMFGTGILIGTIEGVMAKEDNRNIIEQKIDQKKDISLDTNIKQVILLKPKTNIKQDSGMRQDIALEQKPNIKIDLKKETPLEQLQTIKNIILKIPRIKTPEPRKPIEPPPKKPEYNLGKTPKTKSRVQEEVGRLFEAIRVSKGREESLGFERTPYLAGQKLKKVLKEELSASGFVKRKGGEKLAFSELAGVFGGEFRAGVSDPFRVVQRRGTRLGTSQEVFRIGQAKRNKRGGWL